MSIPKETFDPTKRLDLYFRINRAYAKDFSFVDASDADIDITTHTFTLVIRTNPGDRKEVLKLTLNNGLEFKIYEDNTLTATVTAAQTDIREGQYFWELIATDLEETWLNGWAYFHNGIFDGG